MASNEFQREIGSLLSKTFPISERLDDSFNNRYGGFQVSKKPYDFYGCDKNGTLWVLEAKRVKSVRFPLNNLKPHQKTALKSVHANKGNSFVAINWRCGNKGGVSILTTISNYLTVERRVKKEGRKSIKASDFSSFWFLNKIKGGWEIPQKHRIRRLL